MFDPGSHGWARMVAVVMTISYRLSSICFFLFLLSTKFFFRPEDIEGDETDR